MTWPVGKLEQLIKIQELQRQLEEVQSARRGIVIHSYGEPTRAAWELAYQQQRSGSLPIPPGTKLCWYDMRSGWVKTYTTAWDRENGTATSGEIYPYSRNQNTDYFRFLGNIDVAGYIRGAENNTPSLHFGTNVGLRQRQNLLMLDIHYRLNIPSGGNAANFYINLGSIVVQVDLSGVLWRQVEGFFNGSTPGVSATNSSSSSQNALQEVGIGANQRPTTGGFEESPTVYRIKIFNPFNSRASDGRQSGFSQVSVLASGFTSNAAYNGGVSVGAYSYYQSVGVAIRNINLDQYYRIFQTVGGAGADDNLVRIGRGWVYGYFGESVDSLEEYP